MQRSVTAFPFPSVSHSVFISIHVLSAARPWFELDPGFFL